VAERGRVFYLVWFVAADSLGLSSCRRSIIPYYYDGYLATPFLLLCRRQCRCFLQKQQL